MWGDKQATDCTGTTGVLLVLTCGNRQHGLRERSPEEMCTCRSWCWQHALCLRAVCPLLLFPWKAWEGEELTPGPVGLLQTS